VRLRREWAHLIVEVWDDGAAERRSRPVAGSTGFARGWPASTARSPSRARPAGRRWFAPRSRSRRWPGALRPQVREHRQHPAVVVLRVGQVELAEDVADVLLGRALR
jgi:hypothetical protein